MKGLSIMRMRVLCVAVALCGVFAALPAVAGAATASKTPTASTPPSWSMDFSLPSAGKSGCLVCHGDEDLVRIENGVPVPLYVSSSELATGPHADTPCTGCHVDFTYTAPHTGSTAEDWKATAKSACKNCHKDEFSDWAASSHSSAPEKEDAAKPAASKADSGAVEPLCGDCHDGHSMEALKGNPEGQAAIHARGLEMCGACHAEYTEAYSDYYHGRAYQRGAPDAPACWDCHEAHLILPSTNRNSSVYTANLSETCSECHNDPGDDYTEQYAGLIHGQPDQLAENPAYSIFDRARDTVAGAFEQIWAIFR